LRGRRLQPAVVDTTLGPQSGLVAPRRRLRTEQRNQADNDGKGQQCRDKCPERRSVALELAFQDGGAMASTFAISRPVAILAEVVDPSRRRLAVVGNQLRCHRLGGVHVNRLDRGVPDVHAVGRGHLSGRRIPGLAAKVHRPVTRLLKGLHLSVVDAEEVGPRSGAQLTVTAPLGLTDSNGCVTTATSRSLAGIIFIPSLAAYSSEFLCKPRPAAISYNAQARHACQHNQPKRNGQ